MLRKGWPESSAERVSGVSLPLQHRLWQEFSATHPAGSSLSRLTLNTAGMCSFSFYLFTGSHTDTHTHLRFLHLPTLPHSFTSPMSLSHSHVPVLSLKAGLFFFKLFSTDRTPSLVLALPYREAETNQARKMEIPQ